MPGSTTELALKTALDSDDNADYLTISLASSLQTVDALFSNTTGHTHSGLHQGGPIGVAAIADGSITSAKITDGTIATIDIAANAVTQFVSAVGSTATPSTTSSTNVDIPELSVTLTTTGGKLLGFVNIVLQMTGTAGNGTFIQLNIDGGDIAGSERLWVAPSPGWTDTVDLVFDLSGYSAASHTIKARWHVTGSGSTVTSSGVLRTLIVMELKR